MFVEAVREGGDQEDAEEVHLLFVSFAAQGGQTTKERGILTSQIGAVRRLRSIPFRDGLIPLMMTVA